jgi:hypothetical protein
MALLKLILELARNNKRNIALVAMLIVYAANKFFNVQLSETEVIEQLAAILGAVGILHGAYKSDAAQKIVAGIKAKKEEPAAK